MTETTSPDTSPLTPEQRAARNWCVLCHLSALTLFLGLPFGNIIGPFLIWIFKKNAYPEVDRHGREALNFQITNTLFALVFLLLAFVFIGIFLLFALAVYAVVLTIVASVQASNGKLYRYPFTLRLIS